MFRLAGCNEAGACLPRVGANTRDQARHSSTSQAFFYGGHQVVALLDSKHTNVSHAMLDPIVFLAQILNGSHTRHRVHLIIAKINTALLALKTVFVEKYANMARMRMGGESNRSLARMIRKSREDYRAMRRGGIGTLLCKNVGKLGQFVRREG